MAPIPPDPFPTTHLHHDYRSLHATPDPTSALITDYDSLITGAVDGMNIEVQDNSGNHIYDGMWQTAAPLVRSDFDDSVATLLLRRKLGWGRLRYNTLLIFGAFPNVPTIDWFDTAAVDIVMENFFVAFQVASDSNLWGVCFDSEPYGFPGTFTYDDQPQKAQHTREEYRAEVYRRAFALGKRCVEYDPSVAWVWFKGYQGYYAELPNFTIEANPYGFYLDFLDGMYDAYGEYFSKPEIFSTGTWAFSPPIAPEMVQVHSINSYLESSQSFMQTAIIDKYVDDPAYQGNSSYFNRFTTHALGTFTDASTDPDAREVGFNNTTPNTIDNVFIPSTLTNKLNAAYNLGVKWHMFFNFRYQFYGLHEIIHPDYRTAMTDFRALKGMWP